MTLEWFGYAAAALTSGSFIPQAIMTIRTRDTRGISRGMWHSVGGGESGWATPDPINSKIVWSTASGSGMVGGIVVRFEDLSSSKHRFLDCLLDLVPGVSRLY